MIQKLYNVKFNCITKKELLADIVNNVQKRKNKYVCLVNVHSLIEAQNKPNYKKAINNSYLSLIDGMPIIWNLYFFYGIKTEKLSGPDIIEDILELSQEKKYKNYFYGSTQKNLEKLTAEIKNKYPGINICGTYSPPFKPLSEIENNEIINNINNSGADILWVALGCPKQELWVYQNCDKLKIPISFAVGAAFDFLSGNKKRSPEWMQKSGLEWLFRLLSEPRRLWKRYLITNTKFIILFIRTLFNKFII